MDLVEYVNKEFWCSFKNNNRTLFMRTLWIMGATKYKNKVILNDITEDITIYYPDNIRQLRGFNGNQKPISDYSLKYLNIESLKLFINEYYVLRDNLYVLGKKVFKSINNNDFFLFRKLFKRFIKGQAKIFSYEYLINSLGQSFYDKLNREELDYFGNWKNKGQIQSNKYFKNSFFYIIKYFDIDLDIEVFMLYIHVTEVLALLDFKLKCSTIYQRIDKRKNGFVL